MAGFHNPIGAFRRKAVYKNEKTEEYFGVFSKLRFGDIHDYVIAGNG